MFAEEGRVIFVEVLVYERQQCLAHPIALVCYAVLLQVVVYYLHLLIADKADYARVPYRLYTRCGSLGFSCLFHAYGLC